MINCLFKLAAITGCYLINGAIDRSVLIQRIYAQDAQGFPVYLRTDYFELTGSIIVTPLPIGHTIEDCTKTLA
jgi:hypothetical protein